MPKNRDRTAEFANTLRQADMFYDLTPQQLDKIAALCSEVTPDKGEIIFEENSSSDELYLVAGGEVDILVNPALVRPAAGQSRGPVIITTIRRGQTFGEIALVDQGLRSASAQCAARRTRLLVIPRDQLIELCDADPDLGYRLMRNIAADLAFKIRGTDLAIRDQLLWGSRT